MTVTKTPVTAALEAHREYEEFEERVREAELEREHARNRLEGALERAGWNREYAAVAPGVALYRHRRGGSTVEFREVVETLKWEASQ
jgi:hypothetical protein